MGDTWRFPLLFWEDCEIGSVEVRGNIKVAKHVEPPHGREADYFKQNYSSFRWNLLNDGMV
jgi:hypothetical protein